MLIKKKLEETVELQLPAFFQYAYEMYMITENETVVRIWEDIASGVLLSTCIKGSPNHEYKLSEAIQGRPISAYDFFKVWHLAMDHLEQTIQTPLLTK